jgi:hypothetical protein
LKALTRETYTPWILFVVLALSVTLVSSCQNYGGKIETVDESFGLAATLIDTGYDLIGLAFSKGTITRDKAVEFRNSLVEAENALRIAEAAYRNGKAYDSGVFSTARAVLTTIRAAIPSTPG